MEGEVCVAAWPTPDSPAGEGQAQSQFPMEDITVQSTTPTAAPITGQAGLLGPDLGRCPD